jgi:hypothetical protein
MRARSASGIVTPQSIRVARAGERGQIDRIRSRSSGASDARYRARALAGSTRTSTPGLMGPGPLVVGQERRRSGSLGAPARQPPPRRPLSSRSQARASRSSRRSGRGPRARGRPRGESSVLGAFDTSTRNGDPRDGLRATGPSQEPRMRPLPRRASTPRRCSLPRPGSGGRRRGGPSAQAESWAVRLHLDGGERGTGFPAFTAAARSTR